MTIYAISVFEKGHHADKDWCRLNPPFEINTNGLALLRSLAGGDAPTSPLNCWPVDSVYEGTADPNVWCGGVWVRHPNGKTWKRTA